MPPPSEAQPDVSLLRHIIDTARDSVLVINAANLLLVDVDANACRLLGYQREELLGQPVSAIECSLQDIFFWDELRGTPQFDGERIMESEWLTRNGTSFPVEKRVTCHAGDDATYWIIHAEDLTRRRTIEADQISLVSKLQTALEATAEGIMVMDDAGNVTNVNRKFTEMWNVSDEVLASHSYRQILDVILPQLENSGQFEATLSRLSESIEIETENILSLKDGRYAVCVSKPQFLRDHPMGRVFSFRDITAMKQAESELMLARDAAEQASLVKSQFLSQMSHELRTPLNAIIGFAQLLEMETAGPARDQLATISRAAKHLLDVINEILDVAKIEAGRIELERIPFSPIQILKETGDLMSILIGEKALEFSIDYVFPLPATLIGDPTRFRQIILNLCTNAIKYTERGGIRIRVESGGGLFSVAVQDTGIGLNQEQTERLFKAFGQADSSTTRRYGGTGLGLFISRQFAQMMGGDITVSSIPGQGSCFVVTVATGAIENLPLVYALPDADAPVMVHTAVPRLMGKVLLAEDGLDNQRLFRALLDRAGLSVTVAENGQQAVEQALAGDFDLVLMDMRMPVMGGLEATSLLRQAAFSKPIIAITANVMKEDVESYLAAGCSGLISKPIDREKFFEMLRQHLKAAEDAPAVPEKAIGEDDLDPDLFAELSRRFRDGLPSTLKELDSAFSEGSLEKADSVSHTLKGTAGSFGYPELTRLAADLNRAIRNSDQAAIGPSYAALKRALENEINC